jgi:hypothetical protein
MKWIACVIVTTILLAPGCTTSPTEPTPGPDLSERCLAMRVIYDRVKAAATEDPSKEAKAELEAAQERLFESGCLKS